MATAKPEPIPPAVPPRRRLRLSLAVVGALLFLAAAWFWPTIHSYGLTGASYGARVACSCRYAGGRSLADCRKDFESGMGLVLLSEDEPAKSVTARFPLVAVQTASFREGQGCVLETWRD